jgi:galactokinase
MLQHHRGIISRGIIIHNHTTSLPVKKGLSSSAAVCALVVRALDQLFGLKMSLPDVMETAYQGERMTPSKCGRMDQVAPPYPY